MKFTKKLYNIIGIAIIVVIIVYCLWDGYSKNNTQKIKENLNGNAKWERCSFYSGGKSGVYTKDQIGKATTTITNNSPNGADPSCGFADYVTNWKSVVLNGRKARDLSAAEFISGYKTLLNYANSSDSADWKLKGKLPCQNCKYGKNGDCNGKIQLVGDTTGPDAGKVACFAHGGFGQFGGYFQACTTNHYDTQLGPVNKAKELFKKRNKNIATIMKYLLNNKMTYATQNVKRWDPSRNPNITEGSQKIGEYLKMVGPDQCSALILKPAFDAAFGGNGGGNFWPTQLPERGNTINYNGIAIAWGHGATTGGCGSFHLMYNPHNNNMTLVNQIGTRAWSGEWSDNICHASQTYLTDGMQGAADSITGLQPYIQPVDSSPGGPIDILLNYIIKNILGKNPDAAPVFHCKRKDGIEGTVAQVQQCYSLTSLTDCQQRDECNTSKDWCCVWDASGFTAETSNAKYTCPTNSYITGKGDPKSFADCTCNPPYTTRGSNECIYSCPANSTPINKNTPPKSFNDCSCNSGYTRGSKECKKTDTSSDAALPPCKCPAGSTAKWYCGRSIQPVQPKFNTTQCSGKWAKGGLCCPN